MLDLGVLLRPIVRRRSFMCRRSGACLDFRQVDKAKQATEALLELALLGYLYPNGLYPLIFQRCLCPWMILEVYVCVCAHVGTYESTTSI